MSDSALLPVLSALGGVALAQGFAMLQSWIERKHKREVVLRTKYEELCLHFLDSMRLPGELLKCESHEETLEVVHQEDGNKMHMLALVYFPSLRPATSNYIQAYAELASTSIAIYNPSDGRVLGLQVSGAQQYIDARNKYLSARSVLQNAIERYAVEYARS
jgi:hypothetical protein